jgi:predicted nucleic acid-binding protein
LKRPIVVDASVAIKWFLSEIHSDEALLILQSKWELWAPDYIWVEFGSTLRKKIRLKEVTVQEAEVILKDFMRFPIQTKGTKLLLNSAWALAQDSGATIYDCLYLALAISRECLLVTADNKFYQSIKNSKETTNARIVWVEDVKGIKAA